MLNAHYKGKINISDYWAVGDRRTISLSAIPTGNASESQPAQSIDFVIIGIKHDDLTSAINGTTKAAITVQSIVALNTTGGMDQSAYEPASAIWENCSRRAWCNDDFISYGLPSDLAKLLKSVTKLSNRYCSNSYSDYSSYRTHGTTDDKVFILSEVEVEGAQYCNDSQSGSLRDDGSQYEYMKLAQNRVKTVSGNSKSWWTRTGHVNSSGRTYFHNIDMYGDLEGTSLVSNYSSCGICPAFCL